MRDNTKKTVEINNEKKGQQEVWRLTLKIKWNVNKINAVRSEILQLNINELRIG